MSCPHLKDGRCTLAEAVALDYLDLRLECRPDERRCGRCLPKSPTSENLPAACLGLVTPHVAPDRLPQWVRFTTAVHAGAAVASLAASAVQPGAARKSAGFGDTVGKALSFVGITESRVDRLAKAFGLKGCGCSGRREKLNQLLPYHQQD